MSVTRVILVFTLLLPSICWAGGFDSLDSGPMASHPLWQRGEPHAFNERFVGNWCTFSVLDLGISLTPIATWLQVRPDREKGSYVVTLRLTSENDEPQSNQPPVVMRGVLVELNGRLFLDLASSEKDAVFHRVFRVVLDRGIPRLIRWQLSSLSPRAASGIGINHDDVVTASTKRLRKFIAEHADDKDVFPTAGENCDKSCFEGLPEGVFPLLPERGDCRDGFRNTAS
jgi:hypothetical protein